TPRAAEPVSQQHVLPRHPAHERLDIPARAGSRRKLRLPDQQTDVGMPGFDRREATVAAGKGMQMDLPRQRRAIEIGFEADKRLANAQKSPAQSTVEAAALAMRADDHARFPALFAGPGANRR